MDFDILYQTVTTELPDGGFKIPEMDYDIELTPDRRKGGYKQTKIERFHITHLSPNLRSIHNLPRDIDGTPVVTIEVWLLIRKESENTDTKSYIGKSEIDNRWYGVTKKAVYGFGVHDIIYSSTPGNNTQTDFVIVEDEEAKNLAIEFVYEMENLYIEDEDDDETENEENE